MGSSSCLSVGKFSSSLTISELLSREDLFWFRFNTITGVIGVETSDFSLDWDISGTGLIFGLVSNSFLISESSFVGDDWNFTGLSGGDCLVLNFINSVDTSLFLSSVTSFVLNSHVLIKYRVVSGLSLLSIENSVLISEASLWLVSVLSDGARSLKDLNLISVSVLFFFSVENLVVSFIGGKWNISVLSLDVITVGYSWLKGVAKVVVVSVRDCVFFGVSLFFLWSILGLSMFTSGLDWNLLGSNLRVSSVFDRIFNLVV